MADRITMSEYYHLVSFPLLPLVIKCTKWEDRCRSKCVTAAGISGMLYHPVKQIINIRNKVIVVKDAIDSLVYKDKSSKILNLNLF